MHNGFKKLFLTCITINHLIDLQLKKNEPDNTNVDQQLNENKLNRHVQSSTSVKNILYSIKVIISRMLLKNNTKKNTQRNNTAFRKQTCAFL